MRWEPPRSSSVDAHLERARDPAVITRSNVEMIQRHQRRHELRIQKNCRFVSPSEFLEYATSRHHLLRSDDREAGIHGLLDPETGTRFLIEEEKLFSHPVVEN